MADGRYEIKVVASDANANPPGMGKTTLLFRFLEDIRDAARVARGRHVAEGVRALIVPGSEIKLPAILLNSAASDVTAQISWRKIAAHLLVIGPLCFGDLEAGQQLV